jgi:ferric-dicitrate binding protein FerR (iron transport regulator)
MNACLTLRERHFAPDPGVANEPAWVEHLRVCDDCRAAFQALPAIEQLLEESCPPVPPVPAFETMASTAATAARRQRRRRMFRRSLPFMYTGLAAGLVAAVVVIGVVSNRARSTAPRLLQTGDELKVTANKARSAVLASGTRLRLDAGNVKLDAVEAGYETLQLNTGRLFLDVPKLAKGRAIAVRTPDVEVRIHGTRLQVSRSLQSTESGTQVQVLEGLVEVRPQGIGRPIQFVRAGETVTVNSEDSHRAALRRSTFEALDHGDFSEAERQIGSLLDTSHDSLQKAEARTLLARSAAARGRYAKAIGLYRQALALLPAGKAPLWGENACAELAFLVEQETPKMAVAAWSECLTRFPSGMHAELARSHIRKGQ